MWNVYSFFTTYAILDSYKPRKVDFSKVEKIDRWILCKTNEFIKKSKEYYSSYQVYKLMKETTILLDDLSNWYVRRNRRRFWRSENDSDKLIAYDTLYSCLVTIIKTISPIIPFLTEEIYSNLVSNISNDEPESIHLCDFPKYNPSIVDDELIDEIDTVISIVKLGRSARNKANLKIRQPLQSINLYSNNEKVIASALNNKNQILEELNIKSMEICKNRDDLVKFNIKPNYATLAQKAGNNMKDIILKLKEVDFDQM